MLIGQLVRSLVNVSGRSLRPTVPANSLAVLQRYRSDVMTKTPTIKSNVPGEKEQLRKPKEWHSFGCDLDDYYTDRYTTHCIGFLMVTMCLCGGTFVYLFLPDWNRRHWAKREAYILLHERERNGQELIDMNYVDPKLIVLPSEEELENVEIII